MNKTPFSVLAMIASGNSPELVLAQAGWSASHWAALLQSAWEAQSKVSERYKEEMGIQGQRAEDALRELAERDALLREILESGVCNPAFNERIRRALGEKP